MANSDLNGIDRLSSLPEPILLHILSFLPTETAATTTVLSKSWQFLWTLVPDLDFDYSMRHQTTVVPSFSNLQAFSGYKEYKTFANFVTRVFLHRREKFIRRFRLSCHQHYDPSDLDLWVSYAMPQNVQELDLDLGYNNHSFRFHCTQQSSKILVVLKLRSVLIILDKVSFPVLKVLHLKMAEFENRDIKFLPSDFPVLEELVIYGPIAKNLEIYLPKLRSLAITLFEDCGLVTIDCPALTHLVVEGRKSREFHLENLHSLVEAQIKIARHRTILRDYDRMVEKLRVHEDESYGGYVMNVVKGISNVGALRLCLPTMNEIEFGSYSFFHGDDIPVFHNLFEVELVHKGYTCEIIILMLQKFENLIYLTLTYMNIGGRGKYAKKLIQRDGRGVDDMKELIQTNIPNCLTSHLTIFCSIGFKGESDEMKVTRYILENALVLKQMKILFSFSLNVEDVGRIQRKLCKYPRGSEGCELEFYHIQSADGDGDSDGDSDYKSSSGSEDLDTDDESFRSSNYDDMDCDQLQTSDSDSDSMNI